MLASSRKPCGGADPMRQARSPALHCGREQTATDTIRISIQARRRADVNIGPYAEGRYSMTVIRPPCLPPPAMPPVFHNIVGRAFTPAGEVCGGPEGHWQGKVRHPSVGWRDGGVHCRFAAEISCKPRQGLAPHPQGTISTLGAGAGTSLRSETPPACGSACIVPEALRQRKPPCGGRDRPPYIAAGNGRRQMSACCPPGPPAGRCKHRPLRRGVTLHDRHPPAMPAAPRLCRPFAITL